MGPASPPKRVLNNVDTGIVSDKGSNAVNAVVYKVRAVHDVVRAHRTIPLLCSLILTGLPLKRLASTRRTCHRFLLHIDMHARRVREYRRC